MEGKRWKGIETTRKKEKVEGSKKGEPKNNSQYWTYHHSQTPGP